MLANYAEPERGRKLNCTLRRFALHNYLTAPVYRSGIKEDHTASWFSHENPQATESRERLAQDSLEMLINWLKDGGNVGIHG